MGRKSAKSKDKKTKRKEDDARVAAIQAVVEEANKLEDPMASLQPFKKYDRNGLQITIECKRVAVLDTETTDWAFELVRSNMQSAYESCEWGWSGKNKKEEMMEDEAWYLIARDQDGKPRALSHFRFEVEDDVEVVYCYEIQLSKEVRRKGLGKFMMQILELIALKAQMKKVMLTVFKNNVHGQDFFRNKLKFEEDETSPEVEHMYDEDYCYQILSKAIGVKKPLGQTTPSNGQHGSVSHGCCAKSNGHVCC